MKLRNHILFSLFFFMLLFVLNFSINFWSAHQKDGAIQLLQKETNLQSITTTIKQSTGDIQNQVTRLGQIHVEGSTSQLASSELKKLEAQSADIAAQIAMLYKLSDGEMSIKVDALRQSYTDLAASWHTFYENFGSNQVQALSELALHTEPLSQLVLYKELPSLEELERQQIETASQELRLAQWWTDRTALIAFVSSLFAAIGIALLVYRRISKGLNTIKQGVESIRNGDAEHRIGMKSKDELGEIATAFDTLSEDLNTTRNQRTELSLELAQRNEEIEIQRHVSESYLHNILPSTVADEFMKSGAVEPKYLEDVTIIFTDFVGFSSSAEKLAADELVEMLHEYFSAFDEITTRYGLEKLKTIGDSYMCAGGLPERNPSHPVDAVMAAMEIVRVVTERRRTIDSQHSWDIRVGIHTGHLIAGMVGKRKFAYDIWGESVNYASRVESSGEPNRIALSGQTYTRVKDFFECENRSKTHSKVSREMDLYFVNGILASLTDDSKQVPPAAFARRYRSYFQKEPPSFPLQYPAYPASNLQIAKDEVSSDHIIDGDNPNHSTDN
jgi:class 3 adenylate cyclase/ABC-type sugar transport system permease subunit